MIRTQVLSKAAGSAALCRPYARLLSHSSPAAPLFLAQELPGSSSPATPPLTKLDSVFTGSGGKTLRGDWVLFHPVYTSGELQAVEVLHREAKTLPDKLAYGLVKLARKVFDFVSGYKHPTGPPPSGLSLEELRKKGYYFDEKQWLNRRDSGWIHTCLEEAENERMHLMTFMTIRQPSILFRAFVLGAQGVFYNLFFLSYIISPKTCHRFVGYLEEEAVVTYTKCIKDLEAGMIPEWSNLAAPEIAIDYWRLAPDAKMLDVIYAVRSDETTHRFVNHSLANLNPATDVNPFALREPDMHVKGHRIEFERDESAQYVQKSHEMLTSRDENP